MELTPSVLMKSTVAARKLAESIRVLIVDDEPLFVELVEVVLGAESGIEIVGVAADGAEAVRLAAELDPDVIVMDISMPVMNGIDATREIRAHDPEARILILTGGTSVTDIDDSRVAGAAAYVTKDRIASDFVSELRQLGDR
jgi:two-component system, NarL family, nitrate/nitrite response regulator NarL